ncbi:MAG TPA: HAMP domain-containing sensor histidine kinase [Candidatus Kapabacteria bacterium]|nr:HAMP domain-containing sensor histidine kinase [Candidatus Kapabacteria bacterium]
MNRPWKTWFIFAICALLILGVMSWVTVIALRLDRSQTEARAQADLEEKIRLALWRMDSILAPLIVQESARPYFAYSAFHPAERAYSKMFNPIAPSEVIVPSPLLTQVSSNILLHFQFDPVGRLTSPRLPEGRQRVIAETHFTTREQLELAAARFAEFQKIISTDANRNRDVLLAAAPRPSALDFNFSPVLNQALETQLQNAPKKGSYDNYGSQSSRSAEELQARAQSVKQAYDFSKNTSLAQQADDRGEVAEGLFQPVWFGDALVLVRRVLVQKQEYVQGVWVDWRALQKQLVDSIADLLPAARLEPIQSTSEDPRLLASLPVRLIPGPVELGSAAIASPIRFALGVGWVCVLLAGIAIALLLAGTLSLSERRASFVSAVTHELRTPLTTFKMYSEMLSADMVPESSRKEYLSTLCAEANRLNHLVENVLAYARLERGSARSRIERIALGQLVERVLPRLEQRATQGGMILQKYFDENTLKTEVHVDVAAVEQILFNLVDNACKYGTPSDGERLIHLEALLENGTFALLRIRDHGAGISPAMAKRLFQPFSKSAAEAAHSAPGVGLGLALSRRLARSLRGDLRFRNAERGASFEVLMPLYCKTS